MGILRMYGAIIILCALTPYITFAQTGSILREYWTGISGTEVSALTGNANYPNNPTGTGYLTSFEAPTNWNDNYGARIRGYVHPPTTGNYTFWIASDDNSELWLSTDDKQSHKALIASVTGYTSSQEWTKYSSQQSDTINLVAGRRYYIEVLHKDGDQNDNCAVGWQLPNSTYERPIPGNRLSPVADNDDYSLWSDTASIFMNTTAAGANVPQNVLNIPVLVRLSESNFNFSAALPDGADLRFAKTDGTHLKYQIEQWDTLTKDAAIWVRIDTVYGNDSIHSITMLWGKNDAVSGSNGKTVFDTAGGFRGVWHMNQSPPDTIFDATIIMNGGIAQGGMTSANSVSGIIGKGLKFDDSTSDYCTMGNNSTLQFTGEVTVSAWIKTTVNNTYMGIGGKMVVTPFKGFGIHKYDNNYFRFQTGNNTTHEEIVSNAAYTDTNWHYIAGVRRGSTNYLYVDGVQQTSTGTLSFVDNGSYAFAGRQYANYEGRFWDGCIDEMRISKNGHSADWIKLCYENQRTGSSFLTVMATDAKPLVSLISHISAVAETSITVVPFSVTASITVSQGTPKTVVVPLAYGGSATAGVDYATLPSSVTVTIPADSLQASSPVSLTPYEDTLDEGNETILATLTADTTFRTDDNDSVTILITDNDQRYPPQITFEPEDLSIMEGDIGTFVVEAGGSPPFNFVWRKNGVPITGAPNSGVYSIPPAPYSDSGAHYSCIVVNNVGSDTSRNALLSVSIRPEAPRILRQPAAQVLTEEDTAIFSVVVAGTPPFTWQWYCDTIAVPSGVDSVLRVGPVTLADNGKSYYCRIENSVAGLVSNRALLTVHKPSSHTLIITGDLFTAGYDPVGNGTETPFEFTVKLYPSATGGTVLYTETFFAADNQAVMVKNGKFAIQLGAGKSNDDLMETVRTNANLFVSFIIARPGGNPETLNRRVPLTASPYALSSLPQLLKGTVNPNSVALEAPIGTHFLRTTNDSTYIRTARGWVILE